MDINLLDARELEDTSSRRLESLTHAAQQRLRRHGHIEHTSEFKLKARRRAKRAAHWPKAQWRHLGELIACQYASSHESFKLLLRCVPILLPSA